MTKGRLLEVVKSRFGYSVEYVSRKPIYIELKIMTRSDGDGDGLRVLDEAGARKPPKGRTRQQRATAKDTHTEPCIFMDNKQIPKSQRATT